MSFLFQEKGKEKGVQTSLMSCSSKHTSNNREEPILLNRREKTSLPNLHRQMSGKNQVNRNSLFYTSRSREALPQGTEPLSLLVWPTADSSPQCCRLGRSPGGDTVPREPECPGAHSPRCHLSCSRSPSRRSCLSHWCSLTPHHWNVLRPLLLLLEGTAERCKATKRSSEGTTQGGSPFHSCPVLPIFLVLRRKGLSITQH